MNKLTLCNGCNCMTKTIRKHRAKYICADCGYNKTLYDYDLWNKQEVEEE